MSTTYFKEMKVLRQYNPKFRMIDLPEGKSQVHFPESDNRYEIERNNPAQLLDLLKKENVVVID